MKLHPTTKAALAALLGANYAGSLRDALKENDREFTDLDFVRQFVPHVIAVGALRDRCDSGVSIVIDAIAEHFGDGKENAEFEAALQRAVGADAKPRISDDVTNAAYNLLATGKRAGYLLGLAVGQQIGPHALEAQTTRLDRGAK